MKKRTNEINIRNFIIGAAASAVLVCFGPVTTPAQATCMSAQTIWAKEKENAITSGEIADQQLCWVWKLQAGEKKMAGAFLRKANLGVNVNSGGPNYADIDLSNADLSGANLRGTVLARAILNGATLTSANLTGSRLAGADFTNADLRGASLFNCGLYEYNEVVTMFKAEISPNEWAQMPMEARTRVEKDIMEESKDIIKRAENVKLTGAKINSATQGTSAAFWKARGGVVVVD